MIRKSKRYLSAMIIGVMVISNMLGAISVSAETSDIKVTAIEKVNTDYEIYPSPQSVEYEEGSFNFGSDVNVVYEKGIDNYTKSRLEDEILKAHSISYEANQIINGKTNILVGVYGSGEAVDRYAEKYTLLTENLFSKTDSYFLVSDNNVITVL